MALNLQSAREAPHKKVQEEDFEGSNVGKRSKAITHKHSVGESLCKGRTLTLHSRVTISFLPDIPVKLKEKEPPGAVLDPDLPKVRNPYPYTRPQECPRIGFKTYYLSHIYYAHFLLFGELFGLESA